MKEIVLKASSSIPEQELEPTFLQGMVNRRMQGYRKYGSVVQSNTHPDKKPSDRIANVEERLNLYKQTGNTEWLLDAAVFAWLEFVFPMHENAHFRATGDAESPGAIMADGTRFHGQAAREEAARIAYRDREGD